MFDYQVSKQAHYEEACRRFATKHNIKQLSADAGMSAQVLRNNTMASRMRFWKSWNLAHRSNFP